MNKDLKIGDFITVVEWLGSTDKSYTTSILEIKARDENLIRCFVHNFCDITTNLDLNRVIVRKVSLEFVRANEIEVKENNPCKATT